MASPDLRSRSAALLLATLVLAGCSSKIQVPNRPPAATFDVLEADGDVLEIYYWLLDLDGDDVNIVINVCDSGNCVTPTASPGGDGVANLPTDIRRPKLHLFRWSAGCDLPEAAFEAPLVLHIVPSDFDEGPPAQSVPFVLNDLGVGDGCTPIEP